MIKSKFLLIIVILINIQSNLTAQSNYVLPDSLEEIIYSKILDTLDANIKFEFYEEKLNHIETNEFELHPFDTVFVFDNETYIERAILGFKYKIESDSLNYEDSILFRTRLKYPDGLFLIGKIRDDEMHKDDFLKKHLNQEDCPDLTQIGGFNDQHLSDNKLGDFIVFPFTKENIRKFKYAVKAYISFSGIKWSKNKEYAIVECGFHYRNAGPSGAGFQATLKNTNGQISIIKTIRIWEE